MPSSVKPWCVYVLVCRGGRLYTGITPDLDKRYRAHSAGRGAIFTKLNPPERILGRVWLVSKSEAAKLEFQVKKLTASTKHDWVTRLPPSSPDAPLPLPAATPSFCGF